MFSLTSEKIYTIAPKFNRVKNDVFHSATFGPTWGDLKFIEPFNEEDMCRDQLGWYFGSRALTKAGDLAGKGDNDDNRRFGLDTFFFTTLELEVFGML